MLSELTIVVFSAEQRKLLAETLRDLANIAAGAMVFGQFVSTGTFSVSLAVVGGGLWIAIVGYAVTIAKGSEP